MLQKATYWIKYGIYSKGFEPLCHGTTKRVFYKQMNISPAAQKNRIPVRTILWKQGIPISSLEMVPAISVDDLRIWARAMYQSK